MLAFETYAEANAWGKACGTRAVYGGGLSKQAWNLMPKIKDIDAAIRPQDQNGIIEAHPELAFQNLNGGVCPEPKRTRQGLQQRVDLLAAQGFDGLERLFDQLETAQATPDDLLDSCALAHVAERRRRGQAICLSGDPLHDDRGLRMEIWY